MILMLEALELDIIKEVTKYNGRKLIVGDTDLASQYPDIAAEWHPTKNGSLTTQNIHCRSKQSVFWKCDNGHEWQTSVRNRTIKKTKCKKCNSANQTSFPEQAIFFYISQVCECENRKNLFGKEIDVYIPLLLQGVEYNGSYFHKNKPHDIVKAKIMESNGIGLIIVKDGTNNIVNQNVVEFDNSHKNYENLNWAIIQVLKILNLPDCDVNINRDRMKILANYKNNTEIKSFKNTYLEIAKEWNYEKNGTLRPENFSPRSGHKVWWKCSRGHEWIATIDSRAHGNGCQKCSGRRVEPGVNNVATLAPQLLEEWDFERNQISPSDVTLGSDQKVWWICKNCGNRWKTNLYHRKKGKGCSKCGHKKTGQKHKKKVICIETNEEFDGIGDAAMAKGISNTCISACCTGRQKTAGGYHWKYADDK